MVRNPAYWGTEPVVDEIISRRPPIPDAARREARAAFERYARGAGR